MQPHQNYTVTYLLIKSHIIFAEWHSIVVNCNINIFINSRRKNPDQFFFRVTLDIGTLDYYDTDVIEDTLKKHIRDTHQLGPIMVTDDEFSFRDFGGRLFIGSELEAPADVSRKNMFLFNYHSMNDAQSYVFYISPMWTFLMWASGKVTNCTVVCLTPRQVDTHPKASLKSGGESKSYVCWCVITSLFTFACFLYISLHSTTETDTLTLSITQIKPRHTLTSSTPVCPPQGEQNLWNYLLIRHNFVVELFSQVRSIENSLI